MINDGERGVAVPIPPPFFSQTTKTSHFYFLVVVLTSLYFPYALFCTKIYLHCRCEDSRNFCKNLFFKNKSLSSSIIKLSQKREFYAEIVYLKPQSSD